MPEEPGRLKFDHRIRDILKEQLMPDPDEMGAPPEGKGGEPSIEDINFTIKPDELITYLKKFIVGQDHAVDMVATKICTHFHRMKLERSHPELGRIIGNVKSNIMLIGPTGVGKTYLIKLIANKLHVPFVKGDATKFSETGYVGGDVDDLVRELVHQVGGNIPLAEYGIIYIDEIDKIASSGNWHGPDVSRSGVQRNLLKLMEETEVDMKVPHDLASQMEAVIETQRTGQATRKKVNTRNILFVMSGAFFTLPEQIARRLKKGGMGFTGERMTGSEDIVELLEALQPQDLMDYGFESEFVGRVPVISYLTDLTVEGLFNIMKNPNSSVIQSKKRDFAAYNIDLEFDDDALWFIAKRAAKHKTGARGLVSVLEDILLPYERSLPSAGVDRLLVTKGICEAPDQHLTGIITDYGFDSFARDFQKATEIEVEFSADARKLAVELALGRGITVRQLLDESLDDYEYGLKLVGMERFNVTRKVLQDPKAYLNSLVKRSYNPTTNRPANKSG